MDQLIGNGSMAFLQSEDDDNSAVAVSTLAQAMAELGVVGIVGRVYSRAPAPRLGVLAPEEDKAVNLYLANICPCLKVEGVYQVVHGVQLAQVGARVEPLGELLALGFDAHRARRVLRFSFSRHTTLADVQRATKVMHQLADHGVIYAETFVSPDFCGGRDVSAWRDYLAAMAEAANQVETERGVILRGRCGVYTEP